MLKESHTHNKQMTALQCISDMDEIVQASWSLFQHAGEAAFKLSARSPLAPALTAKDFPGGQTQIVNAGSIRRINRHTVRRDKDSAPESVSDTDDWVYWNGDLHNPNDSENDCAVDDDSHIPHINSSEHPQCPEQEVVNAVRNIARLVWPIWKSMRYAEKVLVMLNAVELGRNSRGKKK